MPFYWYLWHNLVSCKNFALHISIQYVTQIVNLFGQFYAQIDVNYAAKKFLKDFFQSKKSFHLFSKIIFLSIFFPYKKYTWYRFFFWCTQNFLRLSYDQSNGTAHVRHQRSKTTVLSCHRCLIKTVVEKMNYIKI